MSKTIVYEKLRKFEHSEPWNRCGAHVIMRGSEYVGKILCRYPKDGMGRMDVFLWDWTQPGEAQPIQHSYASGCGYDKLAAAMDGMTFGGIVLKDHPTDWRKQLRDAGYTLIGVL